MNGQNITAMEAKDIEKLVRKAKDDIEKEVRDRLPRKVGITAVNHFRQNFRDAGWPIEAMDFVKSRLENTKDNEEFLMSMNS